MSHASPKVSLLASTQPSDTPARNTSPPATVRKKKGRTNDTSGASSLHRRLTMQLAGIMAHLERNPKDVLSQARVAKINDLLRR